MDIESWFFNVGMYLIGAIAIIVGVYFGWTTWGNEGWLWRLVSIGLWLLAAAGVLWCIVWTIIVGTTRFN